MNNSQNSISSLFADSTNNTAISMEILSKLGDSLSKNQDSVTVNLKDSEGKDISLVIPTIFKINSDIKRLDRNINALSGLDGSTYIKDSDGNFKRILVSKKNTEPNVIEDITTPTTFGRKNNWFFENFITPLIYVTFNLQNVVDDTVRKVSIKRIIINCDTPLKREIFENSLKGRNDIDYDSLIIFLSGNNISYNVDDDNSDLPPSILRYGGTFGVLDYYEEVNIDGVNKRHYKLTNVYYNDNLSAQKNTVPLKVGDILRLKETTRFEIESVDLSSREIVVKRLSGQDPITIGDNILEIESVYYNSKELNINIGYDERQVVFLSPIDTENNITSSVYSKGVAFYSNELTFNNSDGQTITFEEYYKKEVVDFGMIFLSLAKDRQIPSVYGLIPNKPTLESNNFKVYPINTHLEQDSLVKEVQKRVADKNRLLNEINKIDNEITTVNLSIQQFRNNPSEVTKYNSVLEELVRNKSIKTQEYLSTVSSLSTIYRENSKDKITKKYRVRGFWATPVSKIDTRTGPQEVIQYIVSYRYLSLNGNSPDAKKLNYTDSKGNNLVGYFSNWNEFKTLTRVRTYDMSKQEFVWEEEDTENPEKINSNQLDIPINPGEIVEIRVKSLSEAGYPNNPLVSEWSNEIRIEFPQELITQDSDLYSILEEAAREEERAKLLKQIEQYGLERHFRETRTEDNRYYAHSSSELDSGFKDSNGKTINVYEYLNLLRNEIESLKSNLNKVTPIEVKKGKLKVSVEGLGRDGKTKTYQVNNSGVCTLTPPPYYDTVTKLEFTKRRGAIVKHTYNVILENIGNGTLYLNSKYPGLSYENLPTLSGNNLTFRGSFLPDDDYKLNRLYSKVPLKYTGYRTYSDVSAYNTLFGYGNRQSTQTCGQFIYSRYKDVRGQNELYFNLSTGSYTPNLTGNNANLTLSGSTRNFLWNGEYWNTNGSGQKTNRNPVGGGALTTFAVHINHPSINDGRNLSLDQLNKETDFTQNFALEHAEYFNLDNRGGIRVQMEKTLTNNRHSKLGFDENDRFLVGSDTTGAYFYLSPNRPEDIRISGTDYNGVRSLEPGEKITVPVTYEYRILDYFDEADTYKTSSTLSIRDVNKVVNSQYLGVVGGYNKNNIMNKNFSNFGYNKTIGLDIFVKDEGTFSFDLLVDSVYGSDFNTQIIADNVTASLSDRVSDSVRLNTNVGVDTTLGSGVILLNPNNSSPTL